MKARTRKSRWLLIALLFGFLAAVGLTLARHHGAPTVAMAHGVTTPHAVTPQPPLPLSASIGGEHTFAAPAGGRPDDGLTADTDSNSQQPPLTGHSGAPANTSTTAAAGWSNAAGPAGGSSDDPQSPSHHPPASAPGKPPQDGAGGFAYDSYTPLDCELPAGCGAPVAGSILSRQTSGTSGGMPGVHNSGSPSDNTNPGNTGDTGNTGDPPGGDHPVASAPELDPATLGGAVTLLLGSLAVLRSRRSRAAR